MVMYKADGILYGVTAETDLIYWSLNFSRQAFGFNMFCVGKFKTQTPP